MAPRANWKGYLKLSLVSCSVALYSATSVNQRVRFNIINKKTGHRVNNETVDSETREPVEKDQRVKGYEIEKNQYVLLEEDDFDKVALETTHTIEIDSFVPREEVDERYFDETYYLAPEDAVGREAFAVIREAMRAKSVVGIARAVLYRRERILMLRPLGKGLVATSLRYKNEVRSEDAYFDEIPDVKLSQDMIDLAIHIVESKAAHFDPAQFEDRYENALIELIKAKAQGRPPHTIATQKPGNVINLMEALKRSIQSERPELRPPMPSPARRATPKQTRPASRQTAKRGRAKRAG